VSTAAIQAAPPAAVNAAGRLNRPRHPIPLEIGPSQELDVRMTVKGHLALLVVTLALGSLAGVAVAVLLIRPVLRDIARPFHSAGTNIRSNADQLSTAEQSSGVAAAAGLGERVRGRSRPQPGRGRPAGRRREPHTDR